MNNIKQAVKDEIRETQIMIRVLSPGVSRVCRLFSEQKKWDLDISSDERGKYFTLHTSWCSFEVSIYGDVVVVRGRSSSRTGNYDWDEHVSIRAEDFTDDKLARLFGKWYKEHILST